VAANEPVPLEDTGADAAATIIGDAETIGMITTEFVALSTVDGTGVADAVFDPDDGVCDHVSRDA